VRLIQWKRREFIALLGSLAASWPSPLRAQQQSGHLPRIGLLWPGVSPPPSPRMESFRRGLREQGFVDGRNVIIELRYAPEGQQRLPELVAELVRMKVEVICTFGDLAPKIAQQATQTTPIIAIADDMLGGGLVTNLSRPGGNITGVTILAPELSAKRLQVLKSVFPEITRVAALWDPTTGTAQVLVTKNAAQFLNVDVQVLEVRSHKDLATAFEAAAKERAEALNVFSSPFLSSLYHEIIGLAAEKKLPAIYQWREHVEAGGLMSYGPNLGEMWRQTAVMVAKVLAGANPPDMPVEQPAKIELVLNQKAAKALALELPLPVLIQADDVIE
jgi:putative tryptophan/tyrosine transport system substrate-binding protein